MPFIQRARFVGGTDRGGALKELGQIGRMTKEDPLSPLSFYTAHIVIPGMGLGLEGYVLSPIGNLTPSFQKVWSDCWNKFKS